MTRVSGLTAFLAILCVSTSAWAQTPDTPDPDEAVVDDVIVTGRSLEVLTRQFTEEVASPVAGRGLARWRGPVCIGVFNFQRQLGFQIADGLAHLGGSLGVPINDEACEPNILIVGAADGRQVASDWVDRSYRDFRPAISDSAGSREALDQFRTSDRAVRWWAISRPTYFNVFRRTANPTGGPGAVPIEVFAKSQLRGRIRDDLQRLVIILDAARLSDIPADDLIAYLAMVSFAQVDMQADLEAFDTVLNVFTAKPDGGGLTEWDRAYIQSLYAAPDDRRLNGSGQAEMLAERLNQEASLD